MNTVELQIYKKTAQKYPTYKEFEFPDGAYDFTVETLLDGSEIVRYKYDGFLWIFRTAGTRKTYPKRRRHLYLSEIENEQNGEIRYTYEIPNDKCIKKMQKYLDRTGMI